MKKTKYDVSIISAVYNAEEYIREMMDSVIDQSIGFKRIELIMVNDGSPDNSKKIIQEYAEKYPNVVLVDKPNGGVSSARNAGIKRATGKYLMILDPDDYLSKNSVKNLFDFMEKHEETDITTYTMINHWPDGHETEHYRNKFFEDGTKVYDVDEKPYISQACVNIIYRNKFEKNVLYNEGMIYGEDENYNTQVIMQKGKIGFVKDATYYYRRHGVGQASEDLKNPLYSLESVLNNYEKFFAESKKMHGHIPKYIQGIFINAIRWRIQSDMLLPYYLDKKEFDKTTKRIMGLVKQLDLDVLMEHPTMSKYHKFFLLKEMGITPKTFVEDNHFTITINDKVYEEANRIALRVNRYIIYENTLNIVGYIRSIILEYKKPTLILKKVYRDNTVKREKIELRDTVYSSYNSKMKTSEVFGFDERIDLTNIKELVFEVEIEGHKFNCNYEFELTTPFYKKFRMKAYKTKYLDVLFNNKGFVFKKKCLFNNIMFNLIRLGVIVGKSRKAFFYRIASKKYKKQRIWLYCDRKGIIDNGYYQFKHDIKIKDGIKRFYIYDDDLEKIKKHFTEEEIKNNLIQKNSKKDIIMHLAAEYVFSSFSSFEEWNPYSIRESKIYNDKVKSKLIYLQHGILYANLPKMYAKETCNIYNIIVSSEFEKNNLMKNYHYKEEDLVMTGMPRFQEKEEKVEKQNKILYAPSWRVYLIQDPPINGERGLKEKQFLSSKYYQEIDKLINNKELNEVLKKHDAHLDIKLHPIFKGYIPYLKTDLSNIHVVEGNVNEKEYSLFITDFSSYQFDFARMNTPMIYFLPDEIEFKAGLHSYRELDLKLEDAFGDIAKTSDELKDLIIKSVKSGFKQPKKYSDRCKNFFVKESDPQGRIYEIYKAGK